MKIDRITVMYGELKSEHFDNKKYEIELSAKLDKEENPDKAKENLFKQAHDEIKKQIEIDLLEEKKTLEEAEAIGKEESEFAENLEDLPLPF